MARNEGEDFILGRTHPRRLTAGNHISTRKSFHFYTPEYSSPKQAFDAYYLIFLVFGAVRRLESTHPRT